MAITILKTINRFCIRSLLCIILFSTALTAGQPIGLSYATPNAQLRIVSLSPSITEIIAALGAEKSLVGVSAYCNYPESVKKLPRVGDAFHANIEAIIKLHPHMVIGLKENQMSAQRQQLAQLRIPFHQIENSQSIQSVYQDILQIGKWIGKENAANQLIEEMKTNIAAEKEKGALTHAKAIIIIWVPPITAAGPNSFVSDVAAQIGIQNAIPISNVDYPKLDLERIIALNPNLLILTNEKFKDYFQKDTVFKLIQKQGIALVPIENGDSLVRPGPRIPEALKELRQAIRYFSTVK